MAIGRNNGPVGGDESNVPKKADVILRANQAIANKQDELIKQNKINNTRVEAMLENFNKGLKETSEAARQNGELVKQLQSENQTLKQELLYIAKQNENIYAGLAERISELFESAKKREDALAELTDKVNDVCEQIRQNKDERYALNERLTVLTEESSRGGDMDELMLKLNEISDRLKNAEDNYGEISEKIEHIHITAEEGVETVQIDDAFYTGISDKISDIAEQVKNNETACRDIAYKMEDVCDGAKRSEDVYNELSSRLTELSEQSRRSETAYTTLSDKLDAVSVRVQLYGEESARAAAAAAQSANNAAPNPVPFPTFVKEDVDYDKLAQKVADLVSAREVISPDYIASKVAEQIIIPVPEADSTNVNIKLDEGNIARQVADYLNLNGLSTNVTVDEQKIAEHVADLINVNGIKVVAEEHAQPEPQTFTPVFDEEELADRIALKVGSLKSEDFEILVDDNGCTSISKAIADKLDYAAISDAVADKLRYALDLAQAEEPDYEEMAAHISEKITVAGINEDAIADKAAAVLSNYLPDFDMDEISAKVTDAVIDVLNAQFANQPVNNPAPVDSDIVVDEDGVSRMSSIVVEEIEKSTDERFNAIESSVAELKELIVNGGGIESVEFSDNGETTERLNSIEDSIAELKGMLQDGVNANTDDVAEERFNSIDEAIAELKGMLQEGVNANTDGVAEERLNSIDEAIAELKGMLQDGVNANTDGATEERLNSIDEAIAEVKEMLENGEIGTAASSAPASEDRLDSIEDAIAELKEMLENGAANGVDTIVEEHYNDERLNAIEDTIAEVKEMLEGGVSASTDTATEERFNSVEQAIAEIKAMLEDGVNANTDAVSEERFSAVEQRIAEIKEMLENGVPAEDDNDDERFDQIELKIGEVKDILESGALMAPANEAAATSAVEKQEEEPLLKVSEIISQPAPIIIQMPPQPQPAPVEEDEEEEEDDDDRLEKDDDDSGDGEDLYFGEEGVDFSNMMKFNRSFIARIIQGTDQQKNFYGAVKQALLSYKKVNSNIAWGAERFNKGRETVARFKIRGKTLCLYLALDPNEYKVSVYHHLDASENKSMNGTPMMVKIKSPLGVKKAIRLIDEMMEARGGIKRDLLERDYAAMYPYETIEELIEEGLVKDVRKKN
ncbi:MAG: hypothetical protein K2N22_02650 [Clostridia bacterium]|nr:hypothetical protein [Clostridia bacterium]